jgi:hypothetical protein
MKVIKKDRVITITLGEHEAYIMMTGLSEGPLMTDDSAFDYGAELRLELTALLGTDAAKRKAREELEELTPFRLTPQEMEGLENAKNSQNEAAWAAIIARARAEEKQKRVRP